MAESTAYESIPMEPVRNEGSTSEKITGSGSEGREIQAKTDKQSTVIRKIQGMKFRFWDNLAMKFAAEANENGHVKVLIALLNSCIVTNDERRQVGELFNCGVREFDRAEYIQHALKRPTDKSYFVPTAARHMLACFNQHQRLEAKSYIQNSDLSDADKNALEVFITQLNLDSLFKHDQIVEHNRKTYRCKEILDESSGFFNAVTDQLQNRFCLQETSGHQLRREAVNEMKSSRRVYRPLMDCCSTKVDEHLENISIAKVMVDNATIKATSTFCNCVIKILKVYFDENNTKKLNQLDPYFPKSIWKKPSEMPVLVLGLEARLYWSLYPIEVKQIAE